MRELIKRLERLEKSAAADKKFTVITCLVDNKDDEPNVIRTEVEGGEALPRGSSESWDEFKDRAEAHFEHLRQAGILLLYAETQCAN